MALIPLALQLYSVRDDCKKDLASVIRQLADMGYEGVEFAGFHGHDAADVRQMLDDAELRCAGSHTALDELSDEKLETTAAYLKIIGCPYVIVPSLPPERRNSVAACKETAQTLTRIAKKLRKHNMLLGFHCHADDMKPLDGGPSAWEVLRDQTPDTFIMQYDTANGMAGGADPVEPIRQIPRRAITVHLKEYAGGQGKAVVGEGQVPWEQVFRACERDGGTHWYIVEQEGHPSLSPMDAARQCIENLRAMGK